MFGYWEESKRTFAQCDLIDSEEGYKAMLSEIMNKPLSLSPYIVVDPIYRMITSKKMNK